MRIAFSIDKVVDLSDARFLGGWIYYAFIVQINRHWVRLPIWFIKKMNDKEQEEALDEYREIIKSKGAR